MTRKERASILRAQLRAADRCGAGKPFPEQLRRAVVEYAAQSVADGESVDVVAGDLGISAMSIKRWTEREEKAASHGVELRRVEIVAESGPTLAPGVVVHTRNGLRIEGLTLPALAALVRAVG